MKLYTLKRQQYIQRPIQEVFGFFSKPENLAVITPSELGFRILTPSPVPMHTGSLIDYTIKVIGFRVRWRTLIAHFNPPYSFVDVQTRGPFAYWRHTHSFEKAEGGTMMTDEVRYALPFGLFGALVHNLFVKRQLENIFGYRARILSDRFPGAPMPSIHEKEVQCTEV